MAKPIISADSHITEPPKTYVDRIDPKSRDGAPHGCSIVVSCSGVSPVKWSMRTASPAGVSRSCRAA